MPIVGGLDIHRKQLTSDYLDTVTGEVKRGQIAPADRVHLRSWLVRFAGRDDVAFALEGCTGWRYVAEELAGAGVAAHVAGPADTAFARGRKRHAKTGKTDSRHLRELLAEGRLPECRVPAVVRPGVPGTAGDLPRSSPRAHRPGAAARCSSTRAPRRWARPRCAPRKTSMRCGRRLRHPSAAEHRPLTDWLDRLSTEPADKSDATRQHSPADRPGPGPDRTDT